jgi:CRP-like cAMP-binding protein
MNNIDSLIHTGNHILASLTKQDREGLLSDLEPVSLRLSQVLYEMGDVIDYVYFPNSGMCSLVCHTEEGGSLEVGIVGYEGMVELSAFFGGNISQYRVIVQGEGVAWRMRAGAFRQAFKQACSLQTTMQSYIQVVIAQITQSAICSHFHLIESRLCRWLLLCQDVVQSNELQLTQEFLSYMLGSRRAGVSVAAGALQSQGLIEYNRGHITILDRERLEAASCECYGTIRKALDKYLGA